MATTRIITLKLTEVINGVTVDYSANYSEGTPPTVIGVNAYYNANGFDFRLGRNYSPDGTYATSGPSFGIGMPNSNVAPIVAESPLSQEFEDAVLAIVNNIFTNYATI